MRICFSRDRAAQLDLLLTSLSCNAGFGTTAVLYTASLAHELAYESVIEEWPLVRFHREQAFDADLRAALVFATSGFVTFFCDDDVLYRPVPSLGADVLLADARVLTFSLRLGSQMGQPVSRWQWADEPPHDHGYPGSIDGHTFRTADALRMIDGQTIENPLMLETILARRCPMLADERPLMACYPEQALVGVPVNSVAEQAGRPHGERFPQPADELNARFLAGERIDLAALDFSGVDGCLYEIPFVWTSRVAA